MLSHGVLVSIPSRGWPSWASYSARLSRRGFCLPLSPRAIMYLFVCSRAQRSPRGVLSTPEYPIGRPRPHASPSWRGARRGLAWRGGATPRQRQGNAALLALLAADMRKPLCSDLPCHCTPIQKLCASKKPVLNFHRKLFQKNNCESGFCFMFLSDSIGPVGQN